MNSDYGKGFMPFVYIFKPGTFQPHKEYLSLKVDKLSCIQCDETDSHECTTFSQTKVITEPETCVYLPGLG